jgi:hypothetical protein
LNPGGYLCSRKCDLAGELTLPAEKERASDLRVLITLILGFI